MCGPCAAAGDGAGQLWSSAEIGSGTAGTPEPGGGAGLQDIGIGGARLLWPHRGVAAELDAAPTVVLGEASRVSGARGRAELAVAAAPAVSEQLHQSRARGPECRRMSCHIPCLHGENLVARSVVRMDSQGNLGSDIVLRWRVPRKAASAENPVAAARICGMHGCQRVEASAVGAAIFPACAFSLK